MGDKFKGGDKVATVNGIELIVAERRGAKHERYLCYSYGPDGLPLFKVYAVEELRPVTREEVEMSARLRATAFFENASRERALREIRQFCDEVEYRARPGETDGIYWRIGRMAELAAVLAGDESPSARDSIEAMACSVSIAAHHLTPRDVWTVLADADASGS